MLLSGPWACSSDPSASKKQPETSPTPSIGQGSASNQGDDKGEDQDDAPEPSSPQSPEQESDAGSPSPSPGPEPKFDLGVLPESSKLPEDNLGCDIDFLFVVDNSGSMRDEQKNLARSVPKFIATMQSEIKNLESYHIGVISTDESFYNGPALGGPCKELGGLIVRTMPPGDPSNPVQPGGFRDCGPYAKGKNFMTNDDDLSEAFDCAAQIGTLGSGNERPMDALFASADKKLTEAGKCNEGFLREKAILVVVLITDEEDDLETKEDGGTNGSVGGPKEWHKALLDLKGGRPEYLVVLSLIGLPEPNECSETHQTGQLPNLSFEGAEISPRLKEFTSLFGKRGFVGDVCAPDYGDFFGKAVKVLDLACESAPK